MGVSAGYYSVPYLSYTHLSAVSWASGPGRGDLAAVFGAGHSAPENVAGGEITSPHLIRQPDYADPPSLIALRDGRLLLTVPLSASCFRLSRDILVRQASLHVFLLICKASKSPPHCWQLPTQPRTMATRFVPIMGFEFSMARRLGLHNKSAIACPEGLWVPNR